MLVRLVNTVLGVCQPLKKLLFAHISLLLSYPTLLCLEKNKTKQQKQTLFKMVTCILGINFKENLRLKFEPVLLA